MNIKLEVFLNLINKKSVKFQNKICTMPTKSLMDQMVHTFGIVNVIIIFTIIPSNIASSAVLPVNTDKNYIRTQNLGSLLMKLSQ